MSVDGTEVTSVSITPKETSVISHFRPTRKRMFASNRRKKNNGDQRQVQCHDNDTVESSRGNKAGEFIIAQCWFVFAIVGVRQCPETSVTKDVAPQAKAARNPQKP